MDPVKMTRETVKIEGDRNLYKYEFVIEDEPEEEARDATVEGEED